MREIMRRATLFLQVFVIAVVLQVLGGILLPVNGSGNAEAAEKGAKKELYEIRYPNIQWYDPVYIAEEKGWFEE